MVLVANLKQLKAGFIFMAYTLEQYKDAINVKSAELKGKTPSYDDLLWYYSTASYMLEDGIEDKNLIWQVSGFAKNCANQLWQYKDRDDVFYRLYEDTLLMEAQNMNLDSYLLYVEKNREDKDKFYEPRRKCFLKIGLIQALQDMIDDKLDVLSISLPPGTGKTTLEKFLHSAIIGWFPEDYNLFFSHSSDITRMYYDGVLEILTNDVEYAWKEIFPKLKVTSTNAKMMTLNVGKYKPFQSLMCASVGSEMAGKVRCSKFLFVDDMIGKIEEALNINTLNKLWNVYSTDARQRKVTGCKELHLATRWSVHDVIGRLQVAYEGSDRCKFIAYPDIDPQTGESNFAFDINPFTVEFYHDQEKLMDEVTYKCLYKNEPIEREGLLFPEDSLRRYYNLPTESPDEVLGQCDTKGKGTDDMVLFAAYRYGDDYYIDDVVCDNSSDYERQYEQLADLIVRNAVTDCDFERNAGGDRVALEVKKRVEEKGWVCHITDTPTETNKEARIFQCSNWIIQHCLFKDKSIYSAKEQYNRFMSKLVSYSCTGKNPTDDVPDDLSNFALRMIRRETRRATRVIKSPF